jgi:hypothetical protein
MRFGTRARPGSARAPPEPGRYVHTSTATSHTRDDASRPAAAVVISDARVPHWLHAAAVEPSKSDW